MNRKAKRIKIIIVYVILFLIPVGVIVAWLMPHPTCTDGKQNQDEEGIDCGGVCAACIEKVQGDDLVVTESYVMYGDEGLYDVVANVHNPNALFGGEKVFYTIEIRDVSDNVLDTRRGETFILPNENKYIIEVGFAAATTPAKVDVTIERVDWVQFTDFNAPQIVVKNQKVGRVENGTNYARAYGVLANNSPYDFHDVLVNIIILDDRDMPIAVNTTLQETLDANTQREFVINWPHEFPGTITKTIMQAETNVFDSKNFMKKYLSGGRYQDAGIEEE